MHKKHPLTALKALTVALVASLHFHPPANADVTLRIIDRSGQPNVYLGWNPQTPPLAGKTKDNIDIVQSHAYSLSDFTQTSTTPPTYEIPHFKMSGGRMLFSYNTPLSNFGQPSIGDFNDADFLIRYDKVEAFITGSQYDNIDLTYIDFYSIPFSVRALHNETEVKTLKGTNTYNLIASLSAIAANPNAPAATKPNGGTLAQIPGYSPYMIINSNSKGIGPNPIFQNSPYGSTGKFVRIISNGQIPYRHDNDVLASANANKAPANFDWPSFVDYLKYMDGSTSNHYNYTTSLKGIYLGRVADCSTQPDKSICKASYDLQVTFSPIEQIQSTYNAGNNQAPVVFTMTGIVTISGTATLDANQGEYKILIKIPYGRYPEYISTNPPTENYKFFLLDPSGIIGSNPNFFYKYYLAGSQEPAEFSKTDPTDSSKTIPNNILKWCIDDLLAGMNLGTVGSIKTFQTDLTVGDTTYTAGTQVGKFNSQDWFKLGNLLRGSSLNKSVYDYYFDYLQSNPAFYNVWTKAIYPWADAYGFAYSDRIENGRASIQWDASQPNAIDTIEITILPDYENDKPSKLGDIDLDGDVDTNDLKYINSSLNLNANTYDWRDLNKDLKINALDARILTSLCTRKACATK